MPGAVANSGLRNQLGQVTVKHGYHIRYKHCRALDKTVLNQHGGIVIGFRIRRNPKDSNAVFNMGKITPLGTVCTIETNEFTRLHHFAPFDEVG